MKCDQNGWCNVRLKRHSRSSFCCSNQHRIFRPLSRSPSSPSVFHRPPRGNPACVPPIPHCSPSPNASLCESSLCGVHDTPAFAPKNLRSVPKLAVRSVPISSKKQKTPSPTLPPPPPHLPPPPPSPPPPPLTSNTYKPSPHNHRPFTE